MVNMQDIADHCGISRTVVSLVLNGRDKKLKIAEKTRNRILEAASRLGYCRNEMAVSLVKTKAPILAFASTEMGGVAYTGRIQNGILDGATASDYAVLTYRLTADNHEEILRKIKGWRVSGVLFHISRLDDYRDLFEDLDANEIPYVTVNLANPNGLGVTSDDTQGVFDAVGMLAKAGCRKIAFVTYTHNIMKHEYMQRRMDGYCAGIRHFLPEQTPCIMDYCSEEMAPNENYQKLIKQITAIQADGVICVSDHIAYLLRQMLPHDSHVRIVGYGGVLPYVYPPLPTICQDFEEMGRKSVHLLCNAINGQKNEENNILLPVRVALYDKNNNQQKQQPTKRRRS